MTLTREQFLSADDTETEVVTIDGFGSVRIRSITGDQRDRWAEYLGRFNDGTPKPFGWKALLVTMGCIDDTGALLFKESEAALIGRKHPRTVNILFDAIQRLSAMTEEAREEIEKKSAPMATNGSGISSQVESPTLSTLNG